MSEQKTKKCCSCKAPFLIFALFLLVAAFFLNANITNENGANVGLNTEMNVENNVDENQEKTGEQIIETSEEKENVISYSFDASDEEKTVFSRLLNYGEENNVGVEYNNKYSYGVFIENISGIKNGDDGKYWQYYVNDILGDVAADKKVLEEGDEVEWRFEEVPF
ncbi:MAG: DUF4430 domain-containing protein [Candidatus Pacebacteria bacterium]|nr:DUF4430 domain-containing protein [Candidatus Paceibacterota bacterium]